MSRTISEMFAGLGETCQTCGWTGFAHETQNGDCPHCWAPVLLLLRDQIRECWSCGWTGPLPRECTKFGVCPACDDIVKPEAEWILNPRRGWFYGEHGGVIRILTFDRYDAPDYDERTATLRLRADDPRPMGVRYSGMEYLSVQRAYSSLPLGVWIFDKWQAEPEGRLP